jgi:hypothetical protein
MKFQADEISPIAQPQRASTFLVTVSLHENIRALDSPF